MTTNEPEHKGDHIEIGNITYAQAVAIGAGAAVYQGLTVEEVAVLLVELKNKDQPTVWNGRIPYLGLTAFQESDAQFFFGRESLVDDLLERVQKASFIVVAGPSGSGKSSVARAGLFHALRNGRLPKSEGWWLCWNGCGKRRKHERPGSGSGQLHEISECINRLFSNQNLYSLYRARRRQR